MSKKTKDKETSKAKGISMGDTILDVGIGTLAVVAGAAAGSFVGRPSLVVGLATLGGGLVLQQRAPKSKKIALAVMMAGAGMMTAPLPEVSDAPAPTGVSGLPTKEDAKAYLTRGTARSKSFAQGIAKKLWLDKTPIKKHIGLGEVDTTTQTAYLEAVLRKALAEANGMDGVESALLKKPMDLGTVEAELLRSNLSGVKNGRSRLRR